MPLDEFRSQQDVGGRLLSVHSRQHQPRRFNAHVALLDPDRGERRADHVDKWRIVVTGDRDVLWAPDVALVQGDVTTIPDALLPQPCSAVLLDVDLTEPTYVALKRFWPRMSPGGVILVDDCQETSSWKARVGYSRFCEEAGLEPHYRYGMGLLTK